MRLLCLLDFDGVLFDSASEAYVVANRATAGLRGYRQDVTLEEFVTFRSVVTDAWQYRRLYLSSAALGAAPLSATPNDEDRRFAELFFTARAELMEDPTWVASMQPYEFFRLLKPYMAETPGLFRILSTRNGASIDRTLRAFDLCSLGVFGQEHIQQCGSKFDVARTEGWLERDRYLTIYVDDMHSHLTPFLSHIEMPLHAGWGYGGSDDRSLTGQEAASIIASHIARPDLRV